MIVIIIKYQLYLESIDVLLYVLIHQLTLVSIFNNSTVVLIADLFLIFYFCYDMIF